MSNLQNTAAAIITRAMRADGVIEGSCYWLDAHGTLAGSGKIADAVLSDLARVRQIDARAAKYGHVYAEAVRPAREMALYSAHEGMNVFLRYCDNSADVAALWGAAK